MKFFIILLCIVPLISARSVSDTANCMGNYLKSKEIHVEGFEASDEPLSEKCQELVTKTKKVALEVTIREIVQIEDFTEAEKCITDGLTDSKYADLILAVTYHRLPLLSMKQRIMNK